MQRFKLDKSASGLTVGNAAYSPASRVKRLSERMTKALQSWSNREFERDFLCTLNDKQLQDMGLTAQQAREEAAKPFWKA